MTACFPECCGMNTCHTSACETEASFSCRRFAGYTRGHIVMDAAAMASILVIRLRAQQASVLFAPPVSGRLD